MRKFVLLAALLAMLVVAALPALAQRGHHHSNGGSSISQEAEQEAESGEANQSFTVTSEGDNSNQCAGITGVANTGNAQNQTQVLQYGSTADDFEFDDTGANLTVTGTGTTTCDQQVNQAAAAG